MSRVLGRPDRFLRRLIPIVMGLMVLVLVAGFGARADDGVAPTVAAGIESAAQAQSWPELYAAVAAGLARQPDQAAAIIALAKAQAPAQYAEIEPYLSQYFADLLAAPAVTLAEPAPVAEVAVAAPPEPAWSGEASVGATVTTGNTDTTTLSAGAAAAYDRGSWRHDISAEADFARDDGVETRQRFETGGTTKYDFSERAYALGFLDFEHDKFSGFDYRVSEGAGLGYFIVDTDPLTISVEAGPGARHSRVKTTGVLETEVIGRAVSELRWQVTDSTKFTQGIQALIGAETTSLESRSALTIAINDHWAARLLYRVDHETDPPAGTKKTDTKTEASLVYEF